MPGPARVARLRFAAALAGGAALAAVMCTTAIATVTQTVTAPAVTVTAPAQTVTRPQTTTVTRPSRSATVTVAPVAPTTTTTASSAGEGSLPWWAGALIALAVVGAGAAIYVLGRRRGRGEGGPPGAAPRGPS